MAISRSREYEADRSGAAMTGSPLALARALEKLESGTRQIPMEVSPCTAQLFIADPLKAFGRQKGGMGIISRWFSTHPPISETGRSALRDGRRHPLRSGFLSRSLPLSATARENGMIAAALRSLGGMPEWPKGADCKSAGFAYGGSNPSPPTGCGNLAPPAPP